MSTENDVARSLRSWLRESRHEDANRVLDAVFDQVPATPQRSASWLARRFPPMNSNFVRVALAAAAVVVIAIVFQFLGNSNTGGPGGTETPQPTATPTAIPEPSSTPAGLLPKGSHRLWDAQGAGGQVTVTIPGPGWYGEEDAGFIVKDNNPNAPDGAGLLVFFESNQGLAGLGDVYVYGDPCRWATTKPDSPVATVDDAVAALTSQASRDASAPVDVTVGGHAGKSITLHVPDDAQFGDCDGDQFRSWIEGPDSTRYHQDPGQIDKIWILDVNGELMILDAAYYEGTPQNVLDELEAIVESFSMT